MSYRADGTLRGWPHELCLGVQIKAERDQVGKLQETAKELRSVVDNQRRDMGGMDAAQNEHIQVCVRMEGGRGE